MKKITAILAAILILCMSTLFAACGQKRLAIPTNFLLDEEDSLSWSDVDDARTYDIEIQMPDGTVQERNTRNTYIRLASLDVGDYIIRVRAIGKDRTIQSEWSEAFGYQKLPDTGFVYMPYAGGAEWTLSSARSIKGDVVMEDFYRNKPVTQVSAGAFRNNEDVTTVKIGANVETIGDRTFLNCVNLVSADIPETVESIGIGLFQGCISLTEANLPEHLTSVPDYTFAYCSALPEVKISENVTDIGASAYYSCFAVKTLTIPDNVETIGEYAFSRLSSLTDVKFGSGITNLGEYSFYNNSALTEIEFEPAYDNLTIGEGAFSTCPLLTEVVLPDGLEAIPQSMFEDCENIYNVQLPNTIKSVGMLSFNGTKYCQTTDNCVYVGNWLVLLDNSDERLMAKTTLAANDPLFHKGIVGIADSVFLTGELDGESYGFHNLTTIEFPASLRYIGVNAFRGCDRLWKITTEFESKLEVLGNNCFRECTNLRSVLLEDSKLKSIGNSAFRDCEMLDNNTDPYQLVPETVEHIGAYAYYGTLLSENFDNYGMIYAGNWVVGFDEENPKAQVTLQDETVGVSDYAFRSDETLQRLEGAQNIKYLGTAAFYNCRNLTTFPLNRRITRIESFTFFQCINLSNIGTLDNINYIGTSAFRQCDSLQAIDLSNSQVDVIEDNAFFGCGMVSKIVLNDRIKSIGYGAFSYILNTKEITIPSSVKRIDDFAFAYNGFEKVNLSEGLEVIGDYAFAGWSYTANGSEYFNLFTEITIPDSVVSIGDYAFYANLKLEKVNLGANVKEIGYYCFFNCINLNSINFPASLESIGDCSFVATSLGAVYLPKTVKYVGSYAFAVSNVTFFMDYEELPESWSDRWNSQFAAVFKGVTYTDEGYLESINTSLITNRYAANGFVMPTREGYVIIGWTTVKGSDKVEYEMIDLLTVPEGLTLYAVWGEAPEEPPEEEQPSSES